tara:strand:- start:167 stop:370 length:204 start_codon:yes stop_codon:yes gene_type:complete
MHLPIIRSLLAPKPRFEEAKENKTVSYEGLTYMKITLITPPTATIVTPPPDVLSGLVAARCEDRSNP